MKTAPTPQRPERLSGLGFSVLAACCFGTVAPLAKVAYDHGADPLALLSVRFAIAALVLLAFLKARGVQIWFGPMQTFKLSLLGAIGYAFEASLFFIALERAPAGIVSLVFFSYPMITVLLSLTFRLEPVRRSTVAALVLGTLGVAIIFKVEGVNLAGPLLALAAAAAVSIYFIAADVVMKGIEAASGALWTAIGAAVSLGVIAPIAGQSVSKGALPAAVALGAITAVAFTALYGALVRIGPSRAAVAQMLEPVVTVLIAAIFLNEVITARIGIGAALVVAALPILATTSHKKETLPAPDSL